MAEHESVHLPGLLAEEFGISRSEARRHLNTGGVRLDDRVVLDFDLPAGLVDGKTIRLGKRREAKIELHEQQVEERTIHLRSGGFIRLTEGDEEMLIEVGGEGGSAAVYAAPDELYEIGRRLLEELHD